MERPERRKERKGWAWLLWWKIDEDDLDEQVKDYDKISFVRSARGISLLLTIFSATITALFVFGAGMSPEALIDSALLLILGFFISLGHRWAAIAAMLLWTLEKAMAIVGPLQSGQMNVGTPVLQFVWWAVFMHAFYRAYRVEQERRKRRPVDVDVFK